MMFTGLEVLLYFLVGSAFAAAGGYCLGRIHGLRAPRLVPSSVQVVEEDVTTFTPRIKSSLMGIVGPATDGPCPAPEYIGPSIPPVRWWQLWRYHQRDQYRRECRAARVRFEEVFGAPRG